MALTLYFIMSPVVFFSEKRSINSVSKLKKLREKMNVLCLWKENRE